MHEMVNNDEQWGLFNVDKFSVKSSFWPLMNEKYPNPLIFLSNSSPSSLCFCFNQVGWTRSSQFGCDLIFPLPDRQVVTYRVSAFNRRRSQPKGPLPSQALTSAANATNASASAPLAIPHVPFAPPDFRLFNRPPASPTVSLELPTTLSLCPRGTSHRRCVGCQDSVCACFSANRNPSDQLVQSEICSFDHAEHEVTANDGCFMYNPGGYKPDIRLLPQRIPSIEIPSTDNSVPNTIFGSSHLY
ncbi:unnamed protein product [Protopolystoma xenopodis]|uniref:Uncharacterized protein n=1 Tax=Protopolystoma xenopodis TaxID=117903 RepID=A0A3S5AQJ3_9PLAT|nr:unnamed protein product [Protopolystoma xenopodis]